MRAGSRGYGDKFYQVVGTVKNDSPDTVGAILVRTELLDDVRQGGRDASKAGTRAPRRSAT